MSKQAIGVTGPLRLQGHAAAYDHGNGVCVKPRCKCGWIGKARPPSAARSDYRNHLAVAAMRVAKSAASESRVA